MTWSWNRKRQHPEPLVTAEQSAEARREGEEDLASTRARGGEVTRLSNHLRRERCENHFSALVLRAIQERR
ncbi:hypothetical protein BJF83_00985 [Nocardiopsis sp. CNR-923]|uniref:DUF7620 family protein n=1 Tax=Nocardiopsis sp. CNR-923 TaxID=1904965 RepID=UPI000963F7A3|nr:hypothetical protein [Nocardiopsis sp. CNR-923]OLT28103.1 hypothetical protein BJF83_00985 [Nocardiopsis sp. CNR-923]